MLAVAANAWLIGAVLAGALPSLALIALVAAIPSARAGDSAHHRGGFAA